MADVESIVLREIRNDQGDIVGGWKRLPNGDLCGWYAPYIPVMFQAKPDYLAITRDIVRSLR